MATLTGNNLLDDSLSGTSGADIVQGLGGNDTLLGRGGNDSLEGGDGNDYLNGGTGTNTLAGGAGDDTYEINAATDVVIESAGEGTDKVRTWANNYTLGDNVEQLELLGTVGIGMGNAHANLLQGNNASNTISGMDGNDVVEGRAGADNLAGDLGDDTVSGGTENDLLLGGDGNDVLLGGTGSDYMDGGDGNDQYEVDNAGDVVNEGAADGIDLVRAVVNYTLGADVENLELSGMAAKGAGNTLANSITGNTVGNILHGGGGADTIDAGAGNDVLWGDAGSDLLQGGAGNDLYREVRGGGVDVIEDAGAGETDTVRFGVNIVHRGLWFTLSGDDLLVRVLGTTGSVRLVDYALNTDHGWQLVLSDGAGIDRAKIDALVSAMAALPLPTAPFPLNDTYGAVATLADSLWYNQAPTDITLDNAAIDENSPAGTLVGNLGAVDPNAGDSATFTLLDDAGGRFEVVGSELRVAAGALLDHEASATHDVTVRVTDAAGLHVDKVFSLAVGDLPEQLFFRGDEVQVNSVVADTQWRPSVCALESGDYVITWLSYQGSSGWCIAGQRYSREGIAQGGEFVANTEPVGGQFFPPVIGALAGGGFVISWAGQAGADTGALVARVFDAAGIAQGLPFRVDVDVADVPGAAAVASLAGGGFVLAWSAYDDSAVGQSDIFMRRYDDSGVATGTPLLVNAYGSGNQYWPAVTALADGGFVAAWAGEGDGDSAGVFVQRFDAAGAAAGIAVRANSTVALEQNEPAVAALKDGGCLVVWQSYTGSAWNILGQRFDDAGNPQGGELAFGSGDCRAPAVTVLDSGDVIVGWQQYLGWTSNVAWAQRFNSTLLAQGPAFLLASSYLNAEEKPALAALPGNDWVAVWQSGGTGGDIHAQRFGVGIDAPVTDITLSGLPAPEHTLASFTLAAEDADDSARSFVLLDNPGGTFAIQGNRLVVASTNGFDFDSTGGEIAVHVGVNDHAGNALFDKWLTVGVQDTLELVDRGGQFAASSDAVSAKWTPCVARLADGGFVVVWSAEQDGSGLGIYVQRHDAAGNRLGSEFRANTWVGDLQQAPSVCGLAGGGFVVSWTSRGQDGSGDGIYAQRYDAAGEPADAEFLVNQANTSGAQFASSVLALAGGGFLVSWESGVEWDGSGVHARLYDAFSTPLSGVFRLNTTVTGDQREVSVSALADGGFIAVWNSVGQDGDAGGVYAKRFGATGNVVVDEFRVHAVTAGNQQHPVAAVLQDGSLVMAWESTATGDSEIVARRFDVLGVAIGDEFRVNTTRGGDQLRPAIVSLDDGGFVIAWATPAQGGIFGQRYDAAGIAHDGEFIIDNGYLSDYPALASLAGNGFVAAWQEDAAILARRFAVEQDAAAPTGATLSGAVREHALGGTVVGEIAVTDADGGRYTLSLLDGAGRFSLQGTTLVVSGLGDIDHEASGGAYAVTVRVTNLNGGQVIDAVVPVPVLDEVDVTPVALPSVRANATHSGATYVLPSVAGLAGGGHVVVWAANIQDGSGGNVYAQRFDGAGVAQGSEFRVNTTVTDAQGTPSVVALSTGDFVVCWESWAQDTSGNGLYAQRFSATGVAQGTEFRVNTYITNSQSVPALTALPDGGFVVAWQSSGQDGSGAGVYAQRYSSAGTAQDSEFRVNTTVSGDQGIPALATLADGGFVVAWSTWGGIRFQCYTGGGAVVGSETPAGTYVSRGGGEGGLSVAGLPNGAFVVTWTASDPDGSSGTQGRIFTTDGQPASDEFRVNSYTSSSQYDVAVLDTRDDGFLVSWTSYGEDGSGSGIYGRRFSLDGVAQGGEFPLGDYALNNQFASTIAVLPVTGDFVVAWDGLGAGGDGIYTRRFTGANIQGTSGSDSLAGTSGDDTLEGRASDDVLSGGAGLDVAVYSGVMADYVVSLSQAGIVSVTDSEPLDGNDGADVLTSVETLRFANGTELTVDFSATRANTWRTADQAWPAITRLASGDVVVAWHSNGQDGSGNGIYAQRYDSLGAAAGAEFHVSTATADQQEKPAIAALGGGGFVVTWQSYTQDGSYWGIYGQRYDANGVAVGAEFRVNTTSQWEQARTSVTALANGGFVVSWMSYAQDGDAWGSHFQIYAANGATVGSETRVNQVTANSQEYPSVAALANGNFVVAWDSYQDADGFGVYARLYSASGTALGNEVRVNTTQGGAQQYAAVAALSDGGYVVTWQSAGQDGSGLGVYGQRYSAGGVAQGSEFRINVETASDQHSPAVTGLATGGFVVTWVSSGQDGSGLGAYARRYDAAGNPLDSEFCVSLVTDGDQSEPAVVSLADGGFIVSWQSALEDGSGFGIYTRQYDRDGAVVGTELRLGATEITATATDFSDIVRGNALANTLDGGLGHDTFVGDAGNDSLAGSDGVDVVRYTGQQGGYAVNPLTSGGLNEVLDLDTANGDAGDDVLWGIERLEFDGGVYVEASGNSLLIHGGTGNDNLLGQGGSRPDILYSGGGNDTVDGGYGGPTDLDTYVIAAGTLLALDALPDTQVKEIERIDLGAGGVLRVSLSEVLNISSSHDTLQVIGDGGNTVFTGSGWSNTGGLSQDGYSFIRYAQSGAILLIEQGINVQPN